MRFSVNTLERRLQRAGLLIILGLLIEAISLLWNRPTAFLLYIIVGGLLLGAGVLTYLHSLVSPSSSRQSPTVQSRSEI